MLVRRWIIEFPHGVHWADNSSFSVRTIFCSQTLILRPRQSTGRSICRETVSYANELLPSCTQSGKMDCDVLFQCLCNKLWYINFIFMKLIIEQILSKFVAFLFACEQHVNLFCSEIEDLHNSVPISSPIDEHVDHDSGTLSNRCPSSAPAVRSVIETRARRRTNSHFFCVTKSR